MPRQNTLEAPPVQSKAGQHRPHKPTREEAKAAARAGGSTAPAPSSAVSVDFTIIESDRPLSKRFGVVDGRPVKLSGDATLASGRAHRPAVSGDATATAGQLAFLLESLGPKIALVCAPPPAGREVWPLVVDDQVGDRVD